MNTKAKPATPLPWKLSGLYDIRGESQGEPIISSTAHFSEQTAEVNIAYANHAANAYPKLVEALRNVHPGMLHFDKITDLLRELGEE
jgi:uncharacterized iron-regulated membrane protein